MLKSPEEYLSSLSFDLPDSERGAPNLDAAERIFVEKYLGSDNLPDIPVQEPLPLPQPRLAPQTARSLPVRDPEIIISTPAPKLEIVTADVAETAYAQETLLREKIMPEIVVAERTRQATTKEQQEEKAAAAVVIKSAEAAAQKQLVEIRARAAGDRIEDTVAIIAEAAAKAVVKVETAQKIAATVVADAEISTAEAPAVAAAVAMRAFATAREKLRQASHVQVVSFTIADQLFLMPVEGIQEVLRYMELVKVPHAPEFVAGAINLRGTVMPLVHLSALLTNSKTWKYDERSFIIVTESSSLQMGLIIDKVSSMHMIPQQKIIWNAESKLGDAAEFLCSIVDLDDRVCGMIAPDAIAQKVLSEF